MRYYNTKKIDSKKATYNIIFGERSNGKTYALLKKALQNYLKFGGEFAYIRRWKEDIRAKRASTLFNGLIENGEISKLTNGEFEGVHYVVGRFYFCNYEEETKRPIYNESDLIGHVFAISDGEHNKSTSYPNIKTVIYDEFLTNKLYLPDEFVLFMNVISTIVRRRTDVTIYMLGNTVNKYCPYFSEMGLTRIKEMKQGTIDVYSYGQSGLTVAVEYCSSTTSKNSAQNKYFAFNNPKLEMITGGAWELDIYPHLPVKYKPKDILSKFYIQFEGDNFQGDLVLKDNSLFIYFHIKTTELKELDTDLIYSLEYNHKPNYNRNILKPTTKLGSKILEVLRGYNAFYQNNEVGNALNNYFKICTRG